MSGSAIRRALRGALGPYVVHALEWVVSRRTWHGTQDLGRRLGAWGYRLDRRHRAAAAANIRYAFGADVSGEWVADTTRKCLEHLVMLFLEALRMASMSRDELRDVVQVTGLEHLHEALAQGRGAILFSGHFGNWEVGAVRLIYEDLPVIPLSRAASSPRLARAISAVREKIGFPVIPISAGAKGILRALRENQLVPIMPDRFARGNGVTVPFFGRPTHVWQTPAVMAARAGCPVIPAHCQRLPDGTFRLDLDPPAELRHTGNRERDQWENTALLMAKLEARIRLAPEQYTWPYQLWRPDFPLPPEARVAEPPGNTIPKQT